MRNIKLTICYDGTNFKGWQIQGNGERTVQGELTKAIRKFTSEKNSIIGSGRTDTGVHASGQVANFKTDKQTEILDIQKALNCAYLPDDISILKIEEVKDSFHAQKSAKQKTYRYRIYNSEQRDPMRRHFFLHYTKKLNVKRMKEEAKAFVGRKDFKSFQATDSSKPHRQENTIRTIKELKITCKGDLIDIDITANGFLYKMVRNIVGTLLEVGVDKLKKGSVKEILKAKDRSQAPATADALGLCLIDVKY